MSALEDYIADQQSLVIRLSGILEALQICETCGVDNDSSYALIATARDMVEQLDRGLDSVNLPKG